VERITKVIGQLTFADQKEVPKQAVIRNARMTLHWPSVTSTLQKENTILMIQ